MSTDVQRIASSTSRCSAGGLNKVDTTWNEMNALVDVDDEYDAYFSYLTLRVIDEEEVYFNDSYQLTTSKIRKNRSGKGRVKNRKSDLRRNGARVSQTILTNELAGCNENDENCSKKLRKKKSKKNLKQLKLRRRKIAREEIQLEHLKARKENVQARVRDSFQQYYHDQTEDARSSYEHYESYLGEHNNILPAEDLGLDDESMYKRLLNIFEGGEILPEDYDLLLQLDSNNAKSTLPNESLQNIPVLVVGNGDDHTISRSDIKEKYSFSHCEICLESLMELDDGRELRVLPCEHMFCRGCIDYWFQEVSNRCPNLSCYWCQVDDSE